ncbi:MAG TPA: prepilin-type N-terminal cleavage/methylation domain-containing protein [Candidatus Limnocylindria bacterium]|nr:prepilin-type N-terminal cleavage/methylation domain-containing protein [Candidatus Limnocylindria bacterium]
MRTYRSFAPTSRRRPAERGFSLVEVLVALVIFAVGALTLVAMVPLGARKSNSAAQHTLASELAARSAEQLLGTPYDEVVLDPGAHNDAANPYFTRYYVRWNVEANQPIIRCKRITVTVHRPTLASRAVARLVVVKPEWGL